jgi:tetratricopeptide (TPR) repeat protein
MTGLLSVGMYRHFMIIVSVIVIVSLGWIHPDNAIAEGESKDTQTRKREPFLYDPDTWEQLARNGDTEAQFVLGLLHNDGVGVPLDYEKAFFWYQKAAQHNHVDAQYNLAHLYLSGNGVKKDLTQAIHWWHKAAENGHVRAQYNLGFAYFRGIGIQQDPQQALNWMRKAAKRNDARAVKLLKLLESEVSSSPNKPEGITDPARRETKSAPPSDVEQVTIEAKRTLPAHSSNSHVTQQGFDSIDNNSWLFSQPADFFTVQLISSTERSGVKSYIVNRELQGRVKVFKTTRNGEDWWYLLFGSYPTHKAATSALESMNIKAKSVWIRRFGNLHKRRCQTLASIKPAIVGQYCP